jgi:terminase small subunit / prophage DNA-packing protein
LPDLPKSVSTERLAKLLGISDRQVRELAKDGTLIRVSRGNYALESSIAAYCRRLRDAAAGRGGESVQTSLATERARLAREKADAEGMKNARSRGELVEAAQVEREWSDILRGVKAKLLSLPGRVQQRLPHIGRIEISEIDAEVRQTLEGLADDN